MPRKVCVKAHPKSRQRKVIETADGFEIWVPEAPDKGKANVAVRQALAAHLGVAPSCIALVSGSASRSKVFLVDDYQVNRHRLIVGLMH